jgi:hypothetical protein
VNRPDPEILWDVPSAIDGNGGRPRDNYVRKQGEVLVTISIPSSSIGNSSILPGLEIYVFLHKVSSGIRRLAVVVVFEYVRDVRLHITDERVGFVTQLIPG